MTQLYGLSLPNSVTAITSSTYLLLLNVKKKRKRKQPV